MKHLIVVTETNGRILYRCAVYGEVHKALEKIASDFEGSLYINTSGYFIDTNEYPNALKVSIERLDDILIL